MAALAARTDNGRLLTIEVKGTGKDSIPSQVIDLVKQTQESKSKTQNLADTAAMWLTLIAPGSGVLYAWGVVLSPAPGAVLMAASTVIAAINARMLKLT